jgi:hypothetical protein
VNEALFKLSATRAGLWEVDRALVKERDRVRCT